MENSILTNIERATAAIKAANTELRATGVTTNEELTGALEDLSKQYATVTSLYGGAKIKILRFAKCVLRIFALVAILGMTFGILIVLVLLHAATATIRFV